MELKEIVTVSGKGGLFKTVKPTRTGMILESLDNQKTRFIAGPQHRLSLLSEISVYTTDAEGNKPLAEILHQVFQQYAEKGLPVDSKSDASALASFMESVVPDYDPNRVYVSDMKKLVNWYGIIAEYAPEVLEANSSTEEVTEESVSEVVAEVTPTVEAEGEKSKKESKKKPSQKSSTE